MGLSQLVTGFPAAFPTGMRPDGMPPMAAPRKNGVMTDNSAKAPP